MLWSALLLAGYWMWIDKQVIDSFERTHWDLPARIYGRPLEIYAGAKFSRAELLAMLERLGYRAVGGVDGPGQYTARSNPVVVYSRGFPFADGAEAARSAAIYFDEHRISKLTDPATGRQMSLLRLEPPEIDSLNPGQFEDRIVLTTEDIPADFIRMLVAVEDRRFYEHFGIDLRGIVRAAVANMRAGAVIQGGSTLTQQLVKNLYLSHERSFWRKFNEALMAIAIDRRYTKEEILVAYINTIYLGQEGNRAIHGFGLAARFYFGRPLHELGVGESAMLVGMIKGPSLYSPIKYPDRAQDRRDAVLRLLEGHGLINEKTLRALRDQPIIAYNKAARTHQRYASFVDLVRRELMRDYDLPALNTSGLNIYTTLDLKVQDIVDATIDQELSRIESARGMPKGKLEVAAVVTHPGTAEVLAVVGGRRSYAAGFNRVLDARRPVGSLIKPFVYLTALVDMERFNVMTPVMDGPVSWADETGQRWEPRNYDGRTHGVVPLHVGLARSLNLATVNLGLSLGVTRVVATLRDLGYEGRLPEFPSLFLGAVEMSPMDLSQLYQTLAGGGFRMPPRAIVAVTDRKGRAVRRYGLAVKKVVASHAAFLTEYLLTRVFESGTARSMQQVLAGALPLAGKTGTSNDLRDSWFAGYGSNYLGVLWIGYDDNRPTGLTGANGALRVWGEIMRKLGIRPIVTPTPDSVAWGSVSPEPTTVGHDGCSDALRVPYARGYPPPNMLDCTVANDPMPHLWDRIRGMFH